MCRNTRTLQHKAHKAPPSLLTLQNQTTSAQIKINHPPDAEVFQQISDSSALPSSSSQWRAELQLNTDLATPTAERSGLARTSTLPSLLHTPPGRKATATGNVSHPFFLNLLSVCPLPSLSAGAWVTLSFRSCLYVFKSHVHDAYGCSRSITHWPCKLDICSRRLQDPQDCEA